MERTIPLTTGFGEVMAPQTLVTALLIGPDGQARFDAGALHGRSELESQLEFVRQRESVGAGKAVWVVWVAIELDADQRPLRYKGAAVSELLVNLEKRLGYKNLADQVNRMSEAMRGGVNLSKVSAEERALIRQHLVSLGAELLARASDSFKQALGT